MPTCKLSAFLHAVLVNDQVKIVGFFLPRWGQGKRGLTNVRLLFVLFDCPYPNRDLALIPSVKEKGERAQLNCPGIPVDLKSKIPIGTYTGVL